ncbi:hypothetical protein QAD02_011487 [Eretmocerus hayati]|uniref:Uncharacterized protein n=1 Tax=Eretmocerus hayati TaxID=131215 RepID=A0ACC2NYL2_9HYME|nr:hypothetical protein QAD02_011487 [Eretmocerus hayati]
MNECTISYMRIAKFCYAIYLYTEEALLEFLKNGYDVNAQIAPDNPFKIFSANMAGLSALQYACEHKCDEAVTLIINHGADLTLKNSIGSTALHSCIEYEGSLPSKLTDYITERYSRIAPSVALIILSAHVEKNVTVNPLNKHGLSHFHIACVMSHLGAMRLFLDSGVQINEPIHEDSPVLPGYTALHIASRYASLEVVELLMENGADVHARNKDGVVPLQLINLRLEDFSFLALCPTFEEHPEGHQESIVKLSKDTYKIAAILIQKTFNSDTLINELCIACAKKCLISVNQIIDRVVDINVPTDFGFTALHCAALVDLDMTKLLLERGADIFLRSVDGTTPLDICIWKYGYDIIQLLPSIQNLRKYIKQESQSWRIALALHNHENLEDLLSDDAVAQEINTPCISLESPIWPGATPLHLAVISAQNDPREYDPEDQWSSPSNPSCVRKIIKTLISYGASITHQDARGRTPVHLAFYLEKDVILKMLSDPNVALMNQQIFPSENPVDEFGLSHLHIACMTENTEGMRILLNNDASPNEPIKTDSKVSPHPKKSKILLKAGSTPMHIAVRLKKVKAIEILIAFSADIFAKDADGLTPIDLMISDAELKESDLAKITVLLICEYCIVDPDIVLKEEKLNYFKNLCTAVDPIISLAHYGIDFVNDSQIRQIRGIDNGHRLEHVETILKFLETIRDSTRCRLDPSAKAIRCMSSLKKILQKKSEYKMSTYKIFQSYAQLAPCQCSSLVVLDEQSQMTNLHLACALHRQVCIESLVKSGADLNICLSPDSPFFPGYTPLHLAVECCEKRTVNTYLNTVKILLKYGADPTIQDSKGETPLHLADKYRFTEITSSILLDERIAKKNCTSKFGRSHFHIACTSDQSGVVENFLQYGADPNELNYIDNNEIWHEIPFMEFSRCFDFTPLDVAENLEVVKVLLKHGADPKIEDYKGWTALHHAAYHCRDTDIIKTLIRDGGVDVNSRSVPALTALDLLVTEKMEEYDTESQIRVLLELGAYVNHKNFESSSTLARALESHDVKLLKTLVEYGMDVNDLNEHKRSAMHELLLSNEGSLSTPEEYITLIEQLCEKGIDIDCQDSSKQTPLHAATQRHTTRGIVALLASGADINMIDSKGRTPISLFLEDDEIDKNTLGRVQISYLKKIAVIFSKHLKKMRTFNVTVSQRNAILENELVSEFGDVEAVEDNIRESQYSEELEKMANIVFGDEVTLLEFMFMDSHQMIALVENDALKSILKSRDFYQKFPELGGILKLKYRIALRKKAINVARKSLYLLLKMQIPETCTEIIVSCMADKDLKILADMKVQ